MQRSDVAATRARARVVGAVYLLFFVTAVVGVMFVGQAGYGGLGGPPPDASPDDAARMASTFLAHQASFQIGFGLSLVSTACYVIVTGLLYRLFRPVNASVALVAALFSLMGQAVSMAGSAFQLAPAVVLGTSPYLAAIDMTQRQVTALLFVNVGRQLGPVALVFDGLWLLLLGWLVFRSTFLPRALGVLVALAGLGWEAYLVPPLANGLQTPIAVLGIVAEAALMLWLVVIGVDAWRWVARVAGALRARVASG